MSIILQKCESLRTTDELELLASCADTVKQIRLRKNRVEQTKDRCLEKTDPPATIAAKAQHLAEVLVRARHLVCYTGAGISTAACIPDYRGSQGIWTLLQKGQKIGQHDLSRADPTFTHMALYELHRRNILRYVLSQNCDGLHLRSGLPRRSLSEVHGNMYIEVCKDCKPISEYWRLFDTTETTARNNHKTNRRCHACGGPLADTIVHFGERGSVRWPLNWDGACRHAEQADVILCLGSSLKVLKKYSWLWAMDRPRQKRPKIFIVNLQWTPKDAVADMKINGRCDEVMAMVMRFMDVQVPAYNRQRDPIFAHASLLVAEERHTVSQPMLQQQAVDDSEDDDGDDEESSFEESTENDEDCSGSDEKIYENIKIEVKDECQSNGVVVKVENDISSHSLVVKTETKTGFTDVLKNGNQAEYSNGNVEIENKSTIDYPNIPSNSNENDTKLLDYLPSKSLSPSTKHSISSYPFPHCDTMLISKIPSPVRSIAGVRVLKPVKPQLFTNLCKMIDVEMPTKDKEEEEDEKNYNDDRMPHWFDPKYAYSGLHSIIHPPPSEIDLWNSAVIPIFRLNRSDAECEFCFDHYAEYQCQFYRPRQQRYEYARKTMNKGKLILCECCDDGAAERLTVEEAAAAESIECGLIASSITTVVGGCEYESNEKRAKINEEPAIISIAKVQPGWYGKGYRKSFRRKRRA